MIVDINKVIPLSDGSSRYSIRKMKAVLVKQGQIEPLQVHNMGEHYLVFHDDVWGSDIVFAARELGWSNLLVVEMKHYEG